eukprot:g926.t1
MEATTRPSLHGRKISRNSTNDELQQFSKEISCELKKKKSSEGDVQQMFLDQHGSSQGEVTSLGFTWHKFMRNFISYEDFSVEGDEVRTAFISGLVLDPRSIGLAVWKNIVTVLLVFTVIILPYWLVFEEIDDYCFSPLRNPWFFSFIICLYIVNFADFVIQMSTGIMKTETDIVHDRYQILRHYIKKGNFSSDALPLLVPWVHLFFSINRMQYCNEFEAKGWVDKPWYIMFLVIKTVRIFVTEQGDGKQVFLYKPKTRLFMVILLIVVVWHFLTCLYTLCLYAAEYKGPRVFIRVEGNITVQSQRNFKHTGEELMNSTLLVYNRPLHLSGYWEMMYNAVAIMSGNLEEQFSDFRLHIVSLLLYFSNLLVVAYIIDSVNQLIKVLRKSKFQYQDKMDEIKLHMKNMHLKPKLQREIIRYYKYQFYRRSQLEVDDHQQMISKLSPLLRVKVLIDKYDGMIQRCWVLVLFLTVNENLLIRVLENLRGRIYMPGDPIMVEMNEANELYFIKKGTCLVYHEDVFYQEKEDGEVVLEFGDQPILIAKLHEGNFFGEVGIVLDEPRSKTVKAEGWVECEVLDRAIIEDIMFSNAMIYEKMRKMALLRKQQDERVELHNDIIEEANQHMQAGMSGNWERAKERVLSITSQDGPLGDGNEEKKNETFITGTTLSPRNHTRGTQDSEILPNIEEGSSSDDDEDDQGNVAEDVQIEMSSVRIHDHVDVQGEANGTSTGGNSTSTGGNGTSIGGNGTSTGGNGTSTGIMSSSKEIVQNNNDNSDKGETRKSDASRKSSNFDSISKHSSLDIRSKNSSLEIRTFDSRNGSILEGKSSSDSRPGSTFSSRKGSTLSSSEKSDARKFSSSDKGIMTRNAGSSMDRDYVTRRRKSSIFDTRNLPNVHKMVDSITGTVNDKAAMRKTSTQERKRSFLTRMGSSSMSSMNEAPGHSSALGHSSSRHEFIQSNTNNNTENAPGGEGDSQQAALSTAENGQAFVSALRLQAFSSKLELKMDDMLMNMQKLLAPMDKRLKTVEEFMRKEQQMQGTGHDQYPSVVEENTREHSVSDMEQEKLRRKHRRQRSVGHGLVYAKKKSTSTTMPILSSVRRRRSIGKASDLRSNDGSSEPNSIDSSGSQEVIRPPPKLIISGGPVKPRNNLSSARSGSLEKDYRRRPNRKNENEDGVVDFNDLDSINRALAKRHRSYSAPRKLSSTLDSGGTLPIPRIRRRRKISRESRHHSRESSISSIKSNEKGFIEIIPDQLTTADNLLSDLYANVDGGEKRNLQNYLLQEDTLMYANESPDSLGVNPAKVFLTAQEATLQCSDFVNSLTHVNERSMIHVSKKEVSTHDEKQLARNVSKIYHDMNKDIVPLADGRGRRLNLCPQVSSHCSTILNVSTEAALKNAVTAANNGGTYVQVLQNIQFSGAMQSFSALYIRLATIAIVGQEGMKELKGQESSGIFHITSSKVHLENLKITNGY